MLHVVGRRTYSMNCGPSRAPGEIHVTSLVDGQLLLIVEVSVRDIDWTRKRVSAVGRTLVKRVDGSALAHDGDIPARIGDQRGRAAGDGDANRGWILEKCCPRVL
jgi:hypothetical protein